MEQKEIKTINDIDYENNPEGRLLFSALTILTTTEYQDKTPDEVIKIVSAHADKFLGKFSKNNLNVEDNSEEVEKGRELTFEKELESLINKFSIENGSDTPDFLIAEFMSNCLIAYQQVVTKRDKWFGVDMWAADKVSAQRKSEEVKDL